MSLLIEALKKAEDEARKRKLTAAGTQPFIPVPSGLADMPDDSLKRAQSASHANAPADPQTANCNGFPGAVPRSNHPQRGGRYAQQIVQRFYGYGSNARSGFWPCGPGCVEHQPSETKQRKSTTGPDSHGCDCCQIGRLFGRGYEQPARLRLGVSDDICTRNNSRSDAATSQVSGWSYGRW